jgi:agmatinase
MPSVDAPFATLFGFPFRNQAELRPGSMVAFGAPVQSAPPRRPGAELGPAALREVSCDILQAYLASPSRTAVDLSSGSQKRLRDLTTSSDLGDLECSGHVSAATLSQVAQTSAAIRALSGLPVLMGGDHRVFEGLVRGVTAGSNIPAVLSFSDKIALPAGIDVAPLPIADLAATSNDLSPVLCVGVNGLQPSAAWDAVKRVGGDIITADQVYDECEQAVEKIQSFTRGHRSWVCCIDLEVIDSGHAAGTPAVNVGGLTPEQLIALISAIEQSSSVSGVALTNVAPTLDARGLTELAAAEALMALLDHRLFEELEQ